MGSPATDDGEMLTGSEALDEDNMGTDPLEGGMDPADEWSASDQYGTTAAEQAADRPLAERLDEERPDIKVEPAPERPVAATPLEDLDESIDDEVEPEEPARAEAGVLVGDEVDNTGESATRRSGHLVAEPDPPAADEAAYAQEE